MTFPGFSWPYEPWCVPIIESKYILHHNRKLLQALHDYLKWGLNLKKVRNNHLIIAYMYLLDPNCTSNYFRCILVSIMGILCFWCCILSSRWCKPHKIHMLHEEKMHCRRCLTCWHELAIHKIHNEKSNYYCIWVIDLVFLFVWKQTVIFTVVLLTEILVLWAVLCIFRLLIDSAAFAFVHLYPLTERHGGLYLCQQLRRKILQHWRVYSTCAQRDFCSTCITYSTHSVWNTLLYIIN